MSSPKVQLSDSPAVHKVATDADARLRAVRIAAFMADEWVIVSESGVSTREQFLAFVSSGKLTHSAMNRNSNARVRAYGDMAVLTMRQTNTAHYGGEQFDADEWVTDVFVHRGGWWACVLSQITAAADRPPSQATTGSGQ